MKDEYNQKIKSTVSEIDEFKAELEKSGNDKMQKNTKLFDKLIVEKDEEITDLNTLVGKFQGKIKEQRESISTLKDEVQKQAENANQKDRDMANIGQQLAQKKLDIDVQNNFITQLKQQCET